MSKRVTIKRGIRLKKYYARQCKVEAQLWCARFIEIVENICERKIYAEPSEVDKLRLLNLRAWAIKYGVSEEFVIRTLVDYWSKRSAKWMEQDNRRKIRNKTVESIGCKIPTLVGTVSEEILKAAITEEQKMADKLSMQEKAIEVYEDEHLMTPNRIKQADSPKVFVRKYKRMINQGQRSYDKVKGILSRRHYPNSPWY